MAAEQQEAENWKDGAKSKDNAKEEKRLADLKRKEEARKLLEQEEAALKKVPKPKPTGKPAVNRSNVPATVKAAESKSDGKKKADKAAPAAGGSLIGAGFAELDDVPEPVSVRCCLERFHDY